MIPNQWYAILESSEVPRDTPTGVTRMGEKLVLWRDGGGQVICQTDKCAHRGAALSKGNIVDNSLECPFHGLRYDATGRCQSIPASGKNTPVPERFRVHTYPARDEHGLIWLWWGEPRDELPPLPFFNDLQDGFTFSTLRDHWPVHYSRAIENQLDVMHLPFVHHNTIGRGGRTLVDGPLATLQDNKLQIWVYNRVDDGTLPRKPQEIPEPTRPAMLHFHFPNIWQNRIQDDSRIFVAFAPIDESNTMLYVRFYQRFVRVPLLNRFVNWVGRLGNLVILRQDKRVVITQEPRKTWLKMGEYLVQGDRPIVLYRQRREELFREAGHVQPSS